MRWQAWRNSACQVTLRSNTSVLLITVLSSSSLACPVISGRRYSCLSYSSMLPCLLCYPVSVPPLSYLYYTHLFGLYLRLVTGMSTSNILLNTCSSFILIAWPYHFSRFSVIFLDVSTTLVVPLMCSFWILSLLVTPHIHLSILISFTSSRASCPLVVAQVSARYNRAGLTTVL